MTLFICSSCRNLQGTVFCIDRQSDNLNNRLKLSDYTLDRAGNSMITDRDTIYRLALLLGNDTTGYGNWKQYYRIPFDGNRTMRLVLDGGDDPGPREYLILHDEHGKIVRYIEIAAEYGDGPRSKKIYSVLTKDSLYVYTVTTEAFLTGDDFIDDLKSATKLFSVLLASKRPLITALADKLRLKYPLLPTISPSPTMRLEAIRSIIPISCRRYPISV